MTARRNAADRGGAGAVPARPLQAPAARGAEDRGPAGGTADRAAPLRLYRGRVMHRRRDGLRYRFDYPLFYLLLDLDRLGETRSRVFSHNRFNLLSLHDADHGPRDGTPLRPWIDRLLAARGIALEGGPVRLLAMPRVLGHTFNPLSLWFCHGADGVLRAVLCEVNNTFGEHHHYLLHDEGRGLGPVVRAAKAKCFHVSPFIDVSGRYRFRIADPDERLSVAVSLAQGDGPLLDAALTGRAVPASDGNLLRAGLRIPPQGVMTLWRIQRQALSIWWRGGRYHRRPSLPERNVT